MPIAPRRDIEAVANRSVQLVETILGQGPIEAHDQRR
jgi:hypothetical protein